MHRYTGHEAERSGQGRQDRGEATTALAAAARSLGDRHPRAQGFIPNHSENSVDAGVCVHRMISADAASNESQRGVLGKAGLVIVVFARGFKTARWLAARTSSCRKMSPGR